MPEALISPTWSPNSEAKSAPVLVTVVVPHFEDLDSLEQCLAALERQTLARDLFEIVVADNGSPCGASAVERAIAGRATLVVVPERGAGAARNGGVARARGEIIAFTDCDCRPQPDWLSEGLSVLRDYDLIGGRMDVLVDDPSRMSPAEAFETLFAFDNESYVRRRGFSVTANLFCSRKVFDEVGGFVVSGMSEDWEWCLRAGAKGFKIGYAGSAIVGHPARRTWPELLKKWRRINRETHGLMMASPSGRVRWVLRALVSPFLAIASTPTVLFSPKLHGPAQRFAALIVLHRFRWDRLWDSLRLTLTRPPAGAADPVR